VQFSRLETAYRQLPVESRACRCNGGPTAEDSPKPIESMVYATPERTGDYSHTQTPIRENWWTERGSQRFLNDTASLEAAILYVRDGQD
jgi:hypothetical protein